MISLKTIIKIHFNSISLYGGKEGIRDMNLLQSAINRPFVTFDSVDLYPTAIEKAAAVFESILINHPFVDGNKRTALSIMMFILKKEKFKITANEEELYNITIEVAEGKLEIEKIISWLKINTNQYE